MQEKLSKSQIDRGRATTQRAEPYSFRNQGGPGLNLIRLKKASWGPVVFLFQGNFWLYLSDFLGPKKAFPPFYCRFAPKKKPSRDFNGPPGVGGIFGGKKKQ